MQIQIEIISDRCTMPSFSDIAQPLHKEVVRDCSFLYIIAKKSVIMSEAFLVDVSIYTCSLIVAISLKISVWNY